MANPGAAFASRYAIADWHPYPDPLAVDTTAAWASGAGDGGGTAVGGVVDGGTVVGEAVEVGGSGKVVVGVITVVGTELG